MIVEGLTLDGAIDMIAPIYFWVNGEVRVLPSASIRPAIADKIDMESLIAKRLIEEKGKDAAGIYFDGSNYIQMEPTVKKRFLLDKKSIYTKRLKELKSLEKEYGANLNNLDLRMAVNKHRHSTSEVLEYFLDLANSGLIIAEPDFYEGIVIQEALNNSIEHGSNFGKNGGVVFLKYSYGENGLAVIINDPGRGFEIGEAVNRSQGRGMAAFQNPDFDMVKIGYVPVPKSDKPASFRTIVIYSKA